MRRAITLLLMIVLLFGPAGLLQAEPVATGTATTAEARDMARLEDEQEEGENIEDKEEEEEPGLIDVTHEMVSEAILASANWIDSFFYDERAIQEETETRLRLGVSNFVDRKDLLQTNLHTSFRLDLPIFSERLHLLFSREEEDDQTLTPERRAPRPTRREREASVSLRYFLLMSLRRNASISTGLRFRNGSPVFLLEPRYRQVIPVRDWDLRFTQRFISDTEDRQEIRTSFDLERPIRNKYFFRTTAYGIFIHDQPGYFYNLHATLYHPLGRNRMLQYLWSNNFVTRPTHALDEIRFLFSYRQRVWREWLFLEVSPQIAFPREEDYEFSPGVLLRLDIIFGDFSSFRISQI